MSRVPSLASFKIYLFKSLTSVFSVHTKPTVTSALNLKFTVLVGDTFAYRLPTMDPETRYLLDSSFVLCMALKYGALSYRLTTMDPETRYLLDSSFVLCMVVKYGALSIYGQCFAVFVNSKCALIFKAISIGHLRSSFINVKLISKPRLPLSNDCTQVTK